MAQDRIRVLRIIEYTGPRDMVELHLKGITNGTRAWGIAGKQIIMKSVLVDSYPEIIEKAPLLDDGGDPGW